MRSTAQHSSYAAKASALLAFPIFAFFHFTRIKNSGTRILDSPVSRLIFRNYGPSTRSDADIKSKTILSLFHSSSYWGIVKNLRFIRFIAIMKSTLDGWCQLTYVQH